MKSKILLLPTYFPTKDSPIVGSQVKEQAEMLLEHFDIRAIYCMPGMGWKRFISISLLKFFKLKFVYQSCKELIEGGNIASFGVYFFESKWFSATYNTKLKNDAYDFVFKDLVKKGWTPDLLSSRGFEYGGEAACYLKQAYNIPYAHVENTSFLFDHTFSNHKLTLYKDVLSNANKLLFVSNFLLRNTLMHGFIDVDKCVVTGNPVDEKTFYPMNIKESNSFRILFTGYNSFIKDFDTFFKTIKTIKDRGYQTIKIIVAITFGSEKAKNELITLAKSYGINDLCDFRLQVSREEMPNLINQCDLYVSTSLIETFGIGMLEAMACGVPVVATRNGGIEDFITTDNGILCGIGDYLTLSNAISSIIDGEVTFNPEHVRDSVLKKYSKKAFCVRIASIYNEVLTHNTLRE